MRLITATLFVTLLCVLFATGCPSPQPSGGTTSTGTPGPAGQTETPSPTPETETPLGTMPETPEGAPEAPTLSASEKPAEEGLFDFYSIPPDWPRVVPLMTEFKVTEYENTPEGMRAIGHGAVDMSRANNFYTNARKEHVSSNIWEYDPENPSVETGDEQVFFYIGEGQKLVIKLTKVDDTNISFELNYTPAK